MYEYFTYTSIDIYEYGCSASTGMRTTRTSLCPSRTFTWRMSPTFSMYIYEYVCTRVCVYLASKHVYEH